MRVRDKPEFIEMLTTYFIKAINLTFPAGNIITIPNKPKHLECFQLFLCKAHKDSAALSSL